MRVKARLTNAQIDRISTAQSSGDPADDLDFKSLALLFPADPMIAWDGKSWYLSSTVMDDADATAEPWALLDVMEPLVEQINGVAMVLRVGDIWRPVTLTGVYEGQTPTAGSARMSGAMLYTVKLEGMDPRSAVELLKLAKQQPPVMRVIQLMSRLDSYDVWFRLYHAWEVMKGYYPHRTLLFRDWLTTIDSAYFDSYYEFENAANDPALGPNRRHAARNYSRPKSPNTQTAVKDMNLQDAIDFVKKVVVKWVELEYQESLIPQFTYP